MNSKMRNQNDMKSITGEKLTGNFVLPLLTQDRNAVTFVPVCLWCTVNLRLASPLWTGPIAQTDSPSGEDMHATAAKSS